MQSKHVAYIALLQTCLWLAACSGGGGGGSNATANGPAGTYTIGGSISGLTGTVVLQNNGADNLGVSANGGFSFATALAAGSSYSVSVLTQPGGQTCTVSNGSGTASSNVTNVAVTCTTALSGGGGDQYGSGPDPAPDPTGNPTSYELIDAAKTAGTITAEQALIYKVFSETNDARLPAEYRGDNTGFIEGDAHQQVLEYVASVGFANISAATLDILRPFFVPAYREGSWWNQQNPTATKAVGAAGAVTTAASNPNCRGWESGCSLLAEWKNVQGTNVVVWYLAANETTDWSRAVMLTKEYDNTIWPKLTGLMKRTPISDVGSGGLVSETDGRYDILLVDLPDNKEGVTVTNDLTTCQMQSTHIYLSRKLPDRGLIAQAAHEFMHAMQFSTPLVAGQCVSTYYTTQEATAVWATNHVYPKNNWEHVYAKSYLKGGWTAESYDYRPPKPSLFRYGAYVFPLFLETRFGPSIVKGIWDAAGKETSELKAIDTALRAAGSSFEKEWPKFVVANWNRETIDTYRTLDGLTEVADLTDGGIYGPPAGGTGVKSFDVSVGHAAAKYYRIKFGDASERSITIMNGVNFKLDSYDPTGTGTAQMLSFTGLSEADRQGKNMLMFLKVNGAWQSAAHNLNNTYMLNVCRDDAAGNIDEIIFMFANGEIDPASVNYSDLGTAGGAPPGILVSNVGCRDWTGSLSLSVPITGGTESINISGIRFTSATPKGAPVPVDASLDPLFPAYPMTPGQVFPGGYGWNYQLTAGQATWNKSYDTGTCSGSGSLSFSVPDGTQTAMFPQFMPPGTSNHGIMLLGFLRASHYQAMNLKFSWRCTDGSSGTGGGSPPDIYTLFNHQFATPSFGIDAATGLSFTGTGVPTNPAVTGTISLQGSIN